MSRKASSSIAASPGPAGTDRPSYGIAAPGYRLPAATRLGPVRLQVADLARSLPYHTRALGMRLLDQAQGVAGSARRATSSR